MKTFLLISIGFHSLFFALLAFFPAGFVVQKNVRIMEVSFYEGRGYFPKKITSSKNAEITPIRNEALPVKAAEEKIKGPETVSDIPSPDRKEVEGPALGPESVEPGYGLGAGNIDPEAASWFSYVKERVEKIKRYPKKALEEGTQGKSVLEITVLDNGTLKKISIFQSSGSNVLDSEADRTVRAASPFRPLPAKLGKQVTFRLPIKFEVRK